MIYPLLNNKDKTFVISFWAMVLSGILILIWPIMELGVIGSGAMQQYVVVCMQQVRCAQLTRYLPRYELIMVSFFTFTTFVQSATMYYCSVQSFQQSSGMLKNRQIIILLLAIAMFLATFLMANDHNNYIHFLAYPWAQICTILSLGLPVVLIMTALIRGKLKNKPTPAKHESYKEVRPMAKSTISCCLLLYSVYCSDGLYHWLYQEYTSRTKSDQLLLVVRRNELPEPMNRGACSNCTCEGE